MIQTTPTKEQIEEIIRRAQTWLASDHNGHATNCGCLSCTDCRIIVTLAAQLAEAQENLTNLLGKKWSQIELDLAKKDAIELWMGIHHIKSLDDLLQRAEQGEAAAASARETALEETAKICEARMTCGCGRDDCYTDRIPEDIAERIRSLIQPLAQDVTTAVNSPDWVEFTQHVAKWKSERPISSRAGDLMLHPSYLSIIAMGPKAVPYILRQLKTEGDKPDHWFLALRVLTKTNPATTEMSGDFDKIAKAWIEWGEKHEWHRIHNPTAEQAEAAAASARETALEDAKRAAIEADRQDDRNNGAAATRAAAKAASLIDALKSTPAPVTPSAPMPLGGQHSPPSPPQPADQTTDREGE